MTNLSPDVPLWQRRLSRERVLVGAPVLGALVLVALLAGLDGWPRYGRLQEQQQRLEELRRKQASLPGLRRQLVRAKGRVQEAEQQQALLVDLIAGRERIQTFLAQLSREAATTGVVIELYEPSQVSPSAGTQSRTRNSRNDRNRSRSAKAQPAPKDPLASLGYSKTSVLLQAQGTYLGLQGFLRRMESLQLLVQPSDLALKAVAVPSKANDSSGPALAEPRTQLKLRLSFLDRSPSGAAPSSQKRRS